MKFIKFCTIFSFLFLFLTLPKNISAATYYVAGDTGLDTNNGSITTPWKTIQKAADTMIAGDTVNVKGNISYSDYNSCNTYAGETAVVCINVNAGSSGNPITYQAWSGTGIPIIDASLTGDGFVVSRSWVNVYGFEIKDTGAGDNSAGIFVGALSALSNVNISNNVIKNSAKGIMVSIAGSSNIMAANNTIYGIPGEAVRSTNTSFINRNNIINNSGTGIRKGGAAGTVIEDYNLVFGNTLNYNGITAGTHDVNLDPLFVAPSLSNFHLQRLSPAINTGTDLTASGVTTDILGVPRPQGAGFDIGAYEYYDIPVTVTGSYPNFTGTASTIDSGTISSVSYSVDGGTWQTSGVTGTTTFSIVIPQELYIPDGNHTLRVKATDSYTNETDSSIYAVTTFSKDTVVKTTSVNNTCTAAKPEGTPVITDILSISPTQVKLVFQDSWTNTVDSYFVEYGTKPNVYQYSTQSIGGKGTKETVISNLVPNKTYYFRIRNGNNCNVGNWSLPISIKNEELIVNNLETPTSEIKTNAKEVVIPKPTATPISVVQTNQKTNILQTIINWLTNAFNKVF